MIDLKPCPFCGSSNIDPTGWASTDSAGPACDDCGSSAGEIGKTLEENIAAWNQRPDDGWGGWTARRQNLKELMMPVRIDFVGRRFGRLIVSADAPHTPGRRRVVHCRCDCGNELLIDPRSLGRITNSCGCLQREAVAASSALRAKHGGSGRRNASYNIWIKMKSRCLNPNDKKYPIYGGRGILVHQKWQGDFAAFDADMGPRPSALHSIDRINNDGNYEPGNCRWATAVEQSRNKQHHRLVEYEGREIPLSQACADSGVNYRSALYRLNRGKSWRPLPAPPATEAGE